MHPSFERVVTEYRAALEALSAEALERHPRGDPARWSPRQVVEHLRLTYRRSGSAFQERLEKGRITKSRSQPRQRLLQFVMLRLGYFPSGRAAPAMVWPRDAPSCEMDGGTLVGAFSHELDTMDGLLSRCERQFGGLKLTSHQVLGPLTAAEWRKFHVLHAQHHLKQIESASTSSDAISGRSSSTS